MCKTCYTAGAGRSALNEPVNEGMGAASQCLLVISHVCLSSLNYLQPMQITEPCHEPGSGLRLSPVSPNPTRGQQAESPHHEPCTRQGLIPGAQLRTENPSTPKNCLKIWGHWADLWTDLSPLPKRAEAAKAELWGLQGELGMLTTAVPVITAVAATTVTGQGSQNPQLGAPPSTRLPKP